MKALQFTKRLLDNVSNLRELKEYVIQSHLPLTAISPLLLIMLKMSSYDSFCLLKPQTKIRKPQ